MPARFGSLPQLAQAKLMAGKLKMSFKMPQNNSNSHDQPQ
jgi:hypothetical protein